VIARSRRRAGMPIVRNNEPGEVNVMEPPDATWDRFARPAVELKAEQGKPSRRSASRRRSVAIGVAATPSNRQPSGIRITAQWSDGVMTNLLYDRSVPNDRVEGCQVRHRAAERKTGPSCAARKLTLVQDAAGQVESAKGRGAGLAAPPPAGVRSKTTSRRNGVWVRDEACARQRYGPVSNCTATPSLNKPTKDTALAAEVIRLWFDRPVGSPSIARSDRVRGSGQ